MRIMKLKYFTNQNLIVRISENGKVIYQTGNQNKINDNIIMKLIHQISFIKEKMVRLDIHLKQLSMTKRYT